MIYNFAKQQKILFITSITKNLIGTVLVGRVTTSQFPVGTNEELATIGRLYDDKIIKLIK
jgi:hypothetical protein